MRNYVIGVGPGKAGTSWLYSQLQDQEYVSVSRIKETYFFNEGSSNIDEYNRFFDVKDVNSNVALFEVSNQYFKNENSYINIKRLLPSAKIIYFSRNPLDRILSCYKFELMQGYKGSLEAYLLNLNYQDFDNERNISIVDRHFDKSQYFIVDFDELKNNPVNLLDNLASFMGVPYINHNSQAYKNISRYSRFPTFTKIGRRIAFFLRKLKLYSILQAIKSSRKVRTIFYSENIIKLTEGDIVLFKEYLDMHNISYFE